MSDPTLEDQLAPRWQGATEEYRALFDGWLGHGAKITPEEAERIAAAVSSRRWLSEKQLEAMGVRPKGSQQ